jgi:hypothetical protein
VSFEINGGSSGRVVVNKPAAGFNTENREAATPSKHSSRVIEKQGSVEKTKPHSKASKHSASKQSTTGQDGGNFEYSKQSELNTP